MKTVQAFVTEMTRVIRNTDLDDPIQFHAFRIVAEDRIKEFADGYAQQLVSDRDARIKFLDDAFQGMVNTNEGHVSELGDRDREIAELREEVGRLLIYCDPDLGAKYETTLELLATCKPYIALTGIGMYEDRAKILDAISEQLDKK